MISRETNSTKPGRTFDSAYTFSFAVGIGLVLFIAGLVISLTLGSGSSLGLIFGVPLLFAGLIVPLIMMRGFFRGSEVTGACPHCAASLKTLDSTIRLQCPACEGVVGVRDEKFYAVENPTGEAEQRF